MDGGNSNNDEFLIQFQRLVVVREIDKRKLILVLHGWRKQGYLVK